MRNNGIRKHYQQLFKSHGVSEKSVQYADRQTHWARFAYISQFIDKEHSILDLGCGLGHFYEFMKKNNFRGNYCGADIVSEFISNCKERFKEDKKASFILLKEDDMLSRDFDFIIVSGVFNNKRNNNKVFMLETIREMFKACKVGVAINAMSTYVDYKEKHLYYFKPEKLFNFAKKELGGHPILNHNYKLHSDGFPHDYTLTIFKNPQIMNFNI